MWVCVSHHVKIRAADWVLLSDYACSSPVAPNNNKPQITTRHNECIWTLTLVQEWDVCFITACNAVWFQLPFCTHTLAHNCTFFVCFYIDQYTSTSLYEVRTCAFGRCFTVVLLNVCHICFDVGWSSHTHVLSPLSLSPLFSAFLRAVLQRLDAVQEILESNCIALNSVRSLLSHLPDLDRGICSIYHRKVSVCKMGPTFVFFPPTVFSTVSNSFCQCRILFIWNLCSFMFFCDKH